MRLRTERWLLVGLGLLVAVATACVPVQTGANQVPDINVNYNELRDADFVGSMPNAVNEIMDEFLTATGRFEGGALVPGCAIGIMEDNEVAHLEGYGVADVDTNRPFTYATPSVIASVSKTWTALAALRLVELGLLDLDDTVDDYIGSAPAAWSDKTIRELLSHTSGIARDPTFSPGLDDELELSNFWFGLNIPQLGIHPRLVWVSYTQTPDQGFAADQTARYSNTAYMIAGTIIDLVAANNSAIVGSSYDTYESFLWRQVGGTSLTHGMFSPALNEYWRQTDIHNLAKGYDNSGAFTQIEFSNSGTLMLGPAGWEGPAGGWTVTIGDLVRLMTAIQNDRIISAALKNSEMMDVQGSDGNGNWGLGVNLLTRLNLPVYMHDGSYPGYRARYTVWRTEGLGVAIMCNGDNANMRDLTDEIARVFLDGGGVAPGAAGPIQPAQVNEIDDNDPSLSAIRAERDLIPDLTARERRETEQILRRTQVHQEQLVRARALFDARCDGCEEAIFAAIREHGLEPFEPLLACRDSATNQGQFQRCVTRAASDLEGRGLIDKRQRAQIVSWAARLAF